MNVLEPIGVDPDSIRPVNPDLESGSGSRRAKMTHKIEKSAGSSLLRAKGFSCRLDGNGRPL
jgi:hypothetical protein